jgi:hypothetical protein
MQRSGDDRVRGGAQRQLMRYHSDRKTSQPFHGILFAEVRSPKSVCGHQMETLAAFFWYGSMAGLALCQAGLLARLCGRRPLRHCVSCRTAIFGAALHLLIDFKTLF